MNIGHDPRSPRLCRQGQPRATRTDPLRPALLEISWDAGDQQGGGRLIHTGVPDRPLHVTIRFARFAQVYRSRSVYAMMEAEEYGQYTTAAKLFPASDRGYKRLFVCPHSHGGIP